MNEKLKKVENESREHYIWRVYSSKVENNLTNKEVAEIINKELDTNCQESYFRGIKKNYEIGYQEALENVKDNNEIKEKIDELKYERMKTRNQKSELNRLLNKHSKFDLFYDNLKESIKTLPMPKFNELIDYNKNEGSWILTISDIHYNADFISENNIYNREEAKKRFEILLRDAIKLIQKNNINELTILGIGDDIQGLLRLSDIKLNDLSIVDSVVEVSRLIATFLNHLSKYVRIVYRHNIYSNHTQTRPLGSKANVMPSEDLSKIIGNYVKDMLAINDRIKVVLSEKEYAVFELEGQKILFEHGHTERKIENTLAKYSMMTKEFIDIVFLGHFHAGKSYNVGEYNGNSEIIVAPSFCGSDPYADSLGVGSKAMCQLHKVEKNKGVTETYRIILN